MSKEKVYSVVKMRGPLLPMDVSRSVNMSSIMAGAYLSELVSDKRVKYSHIKVGGSPLYYIEGQEEKLQNYSSSLKGPEKKVFELLREKKVIKDNEVEPVTRVSLRNMKDFAKPVEITINGEKNLYWKWYLTPNDGLRELLEGPEKSKEESAEPEISQEKTKQPENQDTKINESPEKETKEPIPPKQESKEFKEMDQESKNVQEKTTKQSEEPKVPKEEINQESQFSEQTTHESDFATKIRSFFEKNNIDILSKNEIRSTEIEYKILLPTAVGKVNYFAIARDKKKLNDSDLASAFVQATLSKLPALFIYSGELTKKAQDKLKSDFKMIATYKL